MTRGAPGMTRARRIAIEGKMSEEITVMATREQKDHWRRLATQTGITLAEFMRKAADLLAPMLERNEVAPLSMRRAMESHFLEIGDELDRLAADSRRRAAEVSGRAPANDTEG